MMARLLGLPGNTFHYNSEPAPAMPTPAPTPAPSPAPSSGLSDIITELANSIKTNVPSPLVNTPTAPTPTPGDLGPPQWKIDQIMADAYPADFREAGGPVAAGKPYVVGEKRPEVFVPEQNGTVVPSVPQARTLGFQDLLGNRPDRNRINPRTRPQPLPRPPVQGAPVPAPNTPASIPATTPSVAPSPTNALEDWANSGGMQFVIDQGQKALSGAQAASGVFNSGATGMALEKYGQDIGKTYLNNYMNQLLGYGQLGLGAGSALSGAGDVSQSTQSGGSTTTGQSGGISLGSSRGGSASTSFGTTSGKSSTKAGITDILAAAAAAA